MSFKRSARAALEDDTLRANLGRATRTIREKRAEVVAATPDWSELRRRATDARRRSLEQLDRHLVEFESAATQAGAEVHWALDADEANGIVTSLLRARGLASVVKAKSLTTDEIGLNAALGDAGIEVLESDLAELIVQLGDEEPSHILVPAIHRNRHEIAELFERKLGVERISHEPSALTNHAREFLREHFLEMRASIVGANFAIAETGTICLVESEGNGRMCVTLPELLVVVMGIEKVIPTWPDLGPLLQVLPRSATGERMNPYTSTWTGTLSRGGPREMHVVLLDNGRSDVLGDRVGRDALRCIKCSACLNVCPVYEHVGGHAYESVYPGPIGAVLSPQLSGMRRHADLPSASSLCGACAAVCPVEIDIPRLLIHLRAKAVEEGRGPAGERAAMRLVGRGFASQKRYERAQRLAQLGRGPLRHLPRIAAAGAWQQSRELPEVPAESFRQWWRRTR